MNRCRNHLAVLEVDVLEPTNNDSIAACVMPSSGHKTHFLRNVRIPPQIPGHFARSRRRRPDSAKTYGNPARGTVSRKTCDFLVPSSASIIGRLVTFTKTLV
jgi:hypothetical protein